VDYKGVKVFMDDGNEPTVLFKGLPHTQSVGLRPDPLHIDRQCFTGMVPKEGGCPRQPTIKREYQG
jgi:hypothetical protein